MTDDGKKTPTGRKAKPVAAPKPGDPIEPTRRARPHRPKRLNPKKMYIPKEPGD